jgi:hypothetical protein
MLVRVFRLDVGSREDSSSPMPGWSFAPVTAHETDVERNGLLDSHSENQRWFGPASPTDIPMRIG